MGNNQQSLCQRALTDDSASFGNKFANLGDKVKRLKNKTCEAFIMENQDFFKRFPNIAVVLISDETFVERMNEFTERKYIEEPTPQILYLKKDLATKASETETQSLGQEKAVIRQQISLSYERAVLKMGSMQVEQPKNLVGDQGFIVNSYGLKYSGCFDVQGKGTFQNYGILECFYPKRTYKGNWKNSLQHGYGTFQYEDGAKYEGQFKEGKKSGRGKLTFSQGSVYQGQFEDDLMHGEGTMTSATGVETEGQWKKGRYEIHEDRNSKSFSISSVPHI